MEELERRLEARKGRRSATVDDARRATVTTPMLMARSVASAMLLRTMKTALTLVRSPMVSMMDDGAVSPPMNPGDPLRVQRLSRSSEPKERPEPRGEGLLLREVESLAGEHQHQMLGEQGSQRVAEPRIRRAREVEPVDPGPDGPRHSRDGRKGKRCRSRYISRGPRI